MIHLMMPKFRFKHLNFYRLYKDGKIVLVSDSLRNEAAPELEELLDYMDRN